MGLKIAQGILLPFLGTSLGAACVFVLRGALGPRAEKLLCGFAAGIMLAASFTSLLLPALRYAAGMGTLAFLPAAGGFLAGMLFLPVLERLLPQAAGEPGTSPPGTRHGRKLFFAVTLHNLPGGIAVGIVMVGWLCAPAEISFAGALTLSLGIALQNLPEGAIISLPLRAEGTPPGRAFLWGVLSGAVEPLGALATLLAAELLLPVLPWLLGLAAGAMVCVVLEELSPLLLAPPKGLVGSLAFALGFGLMLALDTIFS